MSTSLRIQTLRKLSRIRLYNHEETIPVDAVVWTAGIRPVAAVQNIDTEKDDSGRVVLNMYHQLPDI